MCGLSQVKTRVGLNPSMTNRRVLLIASLAFASDSIPAYAECGECKQHEAKVKDIVDTAVTTGEFKTLAAALKAAGLVETLKGKGPFTVFAPTDKAFRKLPKGTVEELLKPENKDKLVAVLTYQVVPGKVVAKDVIGLSEAGTVQGSKVKITVKGDKVRVDNAKVTATDIACSNGMIHVINQVILPPDNADSRAEAVEMMRDAVHRGSHLYNTGHPASCADLYQTTAKRLMELSPSPFAKGTHEKLQIALKHCSGTGCDHSRA